MEVFTHVDISATKGMAYLLIIDFLLLFVLFWRVLSTPSREMRQVDETELPVAVEDQPGTGDKEVSPFGPQWVWKWEIIRVV